MNAEKTPIKVGDIVIFNTGHGMQRGHVIDLLPCITNGRQHASVEIDHELPGIVELVPVDEITRINITFLSSDVNPIPVENGDRRFWVVSLSKL